MSERQLPAPGIYKAKVTDGQKLVLYQVKESGNLAVAIPITLIGCAFSGKNQIVLARADLTINTNNCARVRKMFPDWTEPTPGQLADLDLSIDADELAAYNDDPSLPVPKNLFEARCNIEPWTPPTEPGEPAAQPIDTFKIVFVGPIGGSAQMPEPISKGDMLAKWGAGFKAVAGGTKAPTTKPVAKTPEKPAASPKPTRPSKATVNPLNTDELVWDAYCKKIGHDAHVVAGKEADAFWMAVDAVQPGNDGTDVTSASWSVVADKLGV